MSSRRFSFLPMIASMNFFPYFEIDVCLFHQLMKSSLNLFVMKLAPKARLQVFFLPKGAKGRSRDENA